MQIFDLNKQPLLLRYKNLHSGSGPVRQKAILVGTLAASLAGIGMFFASNWYLKKTRTTELPHTLKPEWQAANAERRRQYNQDVISRHKIGGPAETNPLPKELLEMDRVKEMKRFVRMEELSREIATEMRKQESQHK